MEGEKGKKLEGIIVPFAIIICPSRYFFGHLGPAMGSVLLYRQMEQSVLFGGKGPSFQLRTNHIVPPGKCGDHTVEETH